MTDAELLIECKKGLNIAAASTAQDGVLTQKLLAVKAYMANAGVAAEMLATDLAVGVLVLGVTDVWNLECGTVKFSPVFYTLLSQLALASSVITVTGNPADGATEVELDVQPALTFNSRIKQYQVALKTYDAQETVAFSGAELDVTGKILTLTPAAPLAAATKYAICISAVSYAGPAREYTVLSFTTK